MSAILKAAGCSMNDVVKTTVLLADMGDFAAVNAIYAQSMCRRVCLFSEGVGMHWFSFEHIN
jgi:hypothetical protein